MTSPRISPARLASLQIVHGQPQTKTLARLIETDSRVVGYTIESDGVFIYTDSARFCDDCGSGTFRGDSETAAVRKFRERVQPAPTLPAILKAELAEAMAGRVNKAAAERAEIAEARERLAEPVATTARHARDSALAPHETFATVYESADADARPIATLSRPRLYGGPAHFQMRDTAGRLLAVWGHCPTLARVRAILAEVAAMRAEVAAMDSKAASDAEAAAHDTFAKAEALAERAALETTRIAAHRVACMASLRADLAAARHESAWAEENPEGGPEGGPSGPEGGPSGPEGGPSGPGPSGPKGGPSGPATTAQRAAEAIGRALVSAELARAFALRIKPAERPASGRAARALAELESLGVCLRNPDWRDMLDSSLGFGPAARRFA